MTEATAIATPCIKLDSFLKLANLAMSGGEAKLLIQEGLVQVNGAVETRRGRKLYPGDQVQVDDHAPLTIAGPEQDHSENGR